MRVVPVFPGCQEPPTAPLLLLGTVRASRIASQDGLPGTSPARALTAVLLGAGSDASEEARQNFAASLRRSSAGYFPGCHQKIAASDQRLQSKAGAASRFSVV